MPGSRRNRWSLAKALGLAITCAAAIAFGSSTAAAAPLKVACVGEQTTHSDQLSRTVEYPVMLQSMLGSCYVVQNFGDCCATVVQGYPMQSETHPYLNPPARFSPAFHESVAFAPDVVVIGSWGKHDTEIESVLDGGKLDPVTWQADYEELVTTYLNLPSKPAVYVSTPLPLPMGAGTGPTTDVILPAIQNVAAKYHLPVVPLYAAFLNHPQLYKDATHPTDTTGLKTIADTVYATMMATMGSCSDGGLLPPATDGGEGADSTAPGDEDARGGSLGAESGNTASGDGEAGSGSEVLGDGAAPAIDPGGNRGAAPSTGSGCACGVACSSKGSLETGFFAVVIVGCLLARRRKPASMPSEQAVAGAVCLAIAGSAIVACGQHDASLAEDGADASLAPVGAGPAPIGTDHTGMDGAGSTPGVCPTDFTACDGVCLEASLMGPDCRPAQCPGPPVGTVPPSRAAGVTSRGFDWNVATDATRTTTVTFTPGPVTAPLAPTVAVDMNYRVNGVPLLHTVSLTPEGGATKAAFRWTTQDLNPSDDLDFYFHQTVAVQTLITGNSAPPPAKPLIDTMWFHQTIGQPRDPEPAYPLTVTLAGRFRDRHPNEERYDHYVDTYFDGPVFSLALVDHGDSVDFTITPTARQIASDALTKVDFKHFECFGAGMAGATPSPTPLCFTPPELSAIGVSMFLGDSKYPPGTVQTSVKSLSYGQLLDFELTFVGKRTYYTEFFEYYVGSGRLQPKVQHPWAHAAGDQAITDVTTDQFGYAQHVPNISPAELDNFILGKILFEADFDTHVGYNPPTTFDCPRGVAPGTPVTPIGVPAVMSPLFTTGSAFANMALAAIARPGYTAPSCFSCHRLDGKGPPPDASGMGAALLKLFSTSSDGTRGGPDPMYGTILDQRASGGGPPEVKASVTWQAIDGQFADGAHYALRKPVLTTGSLRDGALAAATHISMRIPRPVFGLGLLEAVPDETILSLARRGSGRPNLVTDPVTGAQRLGRFGWKAGIPSLREQAALAFVNDVGITSPVYPAHRCGLLQTKCLNAVNDAAPELADADLDHIESYLRELSVPPRRNFNDPEAIRGQAIFADIGCIRCHVPNLITSSTFPIAEMRNIDIQPFTDLLLHDMGPGLADDALVEDGTASGSEWRTCPLWGNGTGPSVMFPAVDAFDPNGHPPDGGVYLHDGRARSITEAILWHGGEAQGPHDLFVGMPADARAALVAYVAYPFADPVPLRHCATSSPAH